MSDDRIFEVLADAMSGYHRGLAAGRASVQGTGEFASWHVNDDGSASPQGRGIDCSVKSVLATVGGTYLQVPVIRWHWSTGRDCLWKCGQARSFADAARALLEALEKSDD
jgi:hypothetical protein